MVRFTPWVTGAGYFEFLDWVDEEYPGDRALLVDDTPAWLRDVTGSSEPEPVLGAYPLYTPDSNALWLERVAEWLTSQP